jgi:hypothetical protein
MKSLWQRGKRRIRGRGEKELLKLRIEGALWHSSVEAGVWNYVLLKERRANHQLL